LFRVIIDADCKKQNKPMNILHEENAKHINIRDMVHVVRTVKNRRSDRRCLASGMLFVAITYLFRLILTTLSIIKSSSITGLDRPRGFQEVKVLRFRVNGTGWW